MSKVILVTHIKFWNNIGGSEARINRLVEYLGAEHSINIFFVGKLTSYDIDRLENYGFINIFFAEDCSCLLWKDFLCFKLDRWKCFFSYLSKIFNRYLNRSPSLRSFENKIVRDKFNKFIIEIKPDAVIIQYIRLSYLLDGLKSKDSFFSIIDTHDVMYSRYRDFLSRGLTHWVRISEDEERLSLGKHDLVVAIQEEDALKFRHMLPDKPVVVVGHYVDIPPVRVAREFRGVLGFLAGNNDVNRTSLNWFLENCWPQILVTFPYLTFHVGGAICDSSGIMSAANLHKIGRVASLTDFYNSIDISVNPIMAGGGLKIKNVEALAYGVPLVTTSAGIQGFPVLKEFPLKICSLPEEFVSAITELVKDHDLRESLSVQGIEYIRSQFTHEKVYRELHDRLKSLTA